MKTPTRKQQLVAWRKRREHAQSLKDQGFSLAQIGARIGCTKQRVHQMLSAGKVNGNVQAVGSGT
jgi:hypothetical protein